MAGVLVGRLEPADVLALAVARQNAQVDGQRLVEAEMRLQRLQALPRRDHGHHGKHHVVFRHAEVMHHAVVGGREPHVLQQLARGADLHVGAVEGQRPGLAIAKRNEVARFGIYLAVRGEGLALHPAVEVGVALRGEAVGIHHQRRAVFLQRVELLAVHERRGIGGAADGALHGRIVGERIAITAEQRTPGFLFKLELVGQRVALPEAHLAIREVEAAHHAIAIEVHIFVGRAREVRVGLHSEEGAVELRGNLALHVQIREVQFHAT